VAMQNVDKGDTMLQPFNRHILITPEYVEREEKKEQSTILLPDDYAQVEGKYCSAIVRNTAEDCRFDNLTVGTRILVDRVMIEEVEYEGRTHHLILDNYVIAQVT
jgi:co-chaperonin GroES (HSP10)